MDTAAVQLSPVEQKMLSWKIPADVPSWFSRLRKEARDLYFDLDNPDHSDENWHYGDPRRLSLRGLDIAQAAPGLNGERYERICRLSGRPRRVACLSMVSDSVKEVSSSTPLRDAGVTVMSLRQALALRGDQIQPYWEKPLLKPDHDKFAAGHFALLDNGFFVHIPRNINAPEPIHLIMESGEPGTVVSPHVLILADAFSKAQIFVHYIGSNREVRNLQLGTIQVHIDDGADVHLSKMQHIGEGTDVLTREYSELGRDAKFASTAIHFGGKYVRHELHCSLPNPGASAELTGLHFSRGKQRYDFLTSQNHLAPNTSSNLLYKGAMDDRSRASYQGTITVAEKAQKTDAFQANRSLLLSPEARVDSSPQLEINANDVRCSHGSTTANVSPQELFYLEQRGIRPSDARRLMVSGFLAEVADKIPLSTLRDYAYNHVLERLD